MRKWLAAIIGIVPGASSYALDLTDIWAPTINEYGFSCTTVTSRRVLEPDEYGSNIAIECDGRFRYIVTRRPNGQHLVAIDRR